MCHAFIIGVAWILFICAAENQHVTSWFVVSLFFVLFSIIQNMSCSRKNEKKRKSVLHDSY